MPEGLPQEVAASRLARSALRFTYRYEASGCIVRSTLKDFVPGPLQPATRRVWHLVTLRGSRRIVAWRMHMRARQTGTLSGHLFRKMLYDRRPLLTRVADKAAARGFIAEQVGEVYLPRLLASASTAGGIPWTELPREFVAKVNHGSGGVVLVTDDADAAEQLPPPGSRVDWSSFRVRPERADRTCLADLCGHWLTLDYSWTSGQRSIQWCYQDIERKVIVEELLRDTDGNPPHEYRLFVIGGRVRFIQVEMMEGGRECTPVMTPTWETLPVRFLNPLPRQAPSEPEALLEMLEVAEALGRPMGDFLRVDLYNLGSKIVVGELTNYPYGGRLPVRPRSFDREWAHYWPRAS